MKGFNLSKPRHNRAARELAALQVRLIKVLAIGGGVPQLAEYMKRIGRNARAAALGDTVAAAQLPFAGSVKDALQSKRSLAQLARLNRALPIATKTVCDKAIVKHREVLTSDALPAPGALRIIAEFIRTRVYALALAPGFKLGKSQPKALGSASLSSTRSVGGQAADLGEAVPTARIISGTDVQYEGTYDRYGPYGYRVEYGGAPVTAGKLAWQQVCLERPDLGSDVVDVSRLPGARVVALAERGLKARVITAMETNEIVRGHALRDIFWPLVEAEPTFCLSDDREVETMGQLQVAPGDRICSTDMEAATDFAPFITARAVWWGILLGLVDAKVLSRKVAEDVLEEIVQLHLGPHRCESDGQEAFVSKRGWLMGHPLTWMTLSWLHFGVASSTVGSRSCALKGDDAVVVSSPEYIDQYLTLLERVGMKINRWKTFISKDSAVFCEASYVKK
jgi:hypothetical protein